MAVDTFPIDPHQQALSLLSSSDAELARGARALHTLDPQRTRPHSLREIAQLLLTESDAPGHVLSFSETLCAVARCQLAHFPENLFWDLDGLAAALMRELREHGVARLCSYSELIQRVIREFGCDSPIRFRYAHDFVYGFDWERFVRREPQARCDIGPFDRRFLRHVLSRAVEIRAAIERDDAEYPRLRPGQWRNPFGFSRTPEHELRLHCELARRGQIPFAAFDVNATPDASNPHTALRERTARELGIPENRGS